METLYELTAPNPGSYEDCKVVAERAGLDPESAYALAKELREDGLVEMKTMAGNVRLTSRGRHHLEEAASPTRTAEPSLNFAYINSMTGGQLQQGSHGSTQIQTNGVKLEAAELADIIAKLQDGFAKTRLSEEQRHDAHANLQTLAAQKDARKPNHTILREALSALWEITKETSSHVLGHVIVAYVEAQGWVPLG